MFPASVDVTGLKQYRLLVKVLYLVLGDLKVTFLLHIKYNQLGIRYLDTTLEISQWWQSI